MPNDEKYLAQMIAAHPKFAEHPGAVADIYHSLIKFGPTVMKDPLFAGAWVDHVLGARYPGCSSYQGILPAARGIAEIESLVRRTIPEDELQFGRD